MNSKRKIILILKERETALTVKEKLEKLRGKMQAYGIDAYIIPSTDPHLNEYVPSHFKARAWISGFTGSAGTVVVTFDKAILWTDGRYYIQAEKQIAGTEFELYKMEKGIPNYIEFIEKSLSAGQVVGFDGRNFPCADVLKMKETFEKKGIKIKSDVDLIREIWIEDRPPIPTDKVFIHETTFTGLTARQKLEQVLNEMQKSEVDYYVVSALDSIAWVLNVRGNDVPYVPVVISYLLVSKDSVIWFVDTAKLTDEVREYLRQNNIEVRNYDDIFATLADIPADKKVLIDERKNSFAIYSAVKNAKVVNKDDIIVNLKAVKNEVEIENIKKVHIKDGVAMVNFLYWFDTNIGKRKITELDVVEKLREYRLMQEGCLGPSFDTIAGYNENAAMMHYIPTEENHAVIGPKGILLIDSGGQYLGGTTDITRTIVVNEVDEEQKRDFTLVLKANIAMITTVFLKGSTGKTLDVIARRYLWEHHMNYKCGSGHGIGYCLSVHEGPHGFGVDVPLKPGMLLTIEPGVYKKGRYGIRTENTVVVVEDAFDEDAGQFYRFEVLTYCPLDIRAIDVSLLDEKEINWLNEYHRKVYEVLSPYLGKEQKDWLNAMTQPIG